MRPLKLAMSAFGPYKDYVSLDLESLGTSGIYLITGDTGAGKTTIFDGIVYALYDEASGPNRKESMLRSKYADPETPTFVELEFLSKGARYKIKRSPSYERPSKRGSGLTKASASVELYMPDGRAITRSSEVKAEITSIIGIDKEQFLQIAMIAQGEFLKLLFASTDERTRIFQKLFKTKPYELVQNELGKMLSETEQKHKDAGASISQYVDGIQAAKDSLYLAELERAKEPYEMTVDEKIALITSIIDQDKGLLEKTRGDLARQREELTAIKSRISLICENEKNAKSLDGVKERLAELEKELVIATKEYERQKSAECEAKRKRLDAEIAIIDASLVKYDKLDEINSDIKASKEALDKARNDIGQENKKITDLQKELKALEQEEAELKNATESKLKLKARAQEITGKQNELSTLMAELEAYADLSGEIEKARGECENLTKIYAEKQELYTAKNSAFLRAQAGILATSLDEDKPCPVCGSRKHPCPARLSEGAPTEAELKALEADCSQAQERARAQSEKCATKIGAQKELASKLTPQLNKLFGAECTIENASEYITSVSASLEAEQKAISSEIEAEEKREARHKSLYEKQIPSKREALNLANRALADAKARMASAEASLEANEKRLKQTQDELKYSSRVDAVNAKNELEIKQSELKNAYEGAQKTYNDLVKEKAELIARKEGLQEQLAKTKDYDREREEKALELILPVVEELDKKSDEVFSRISHNQNSLEKIKQKREVLSALDEEYKLIKSLSDTANGRLAGKEKITLETYIQTTYFDKIIIRANRRLMVMTSGQYQLKRKYDNSKQGKTGLDLDVIDHYNGTERSVKSLSGGESFKASLSLALGLAEEIQSSAGGVQIDTMFVDEGFGSLDEDSLNQAMNALFSLGGSSRLVGIISHVSELKQRIDKQIIVTKDKAGGSCAKIALQ